MTSEKVSLSDSKVLRWGVLLLISLVIFSSYYYYDVFTGIKETLTAELDLSNSGYGLMLSYYSFANTFLLMTIFGGIILDRWGIRKTGLLFGSIMVFGAFFTTYGTSEIYRSGGLGYNFMSSFLTGYSPELKMMIFGRFLFGLGSETIIVISSKIMVKWFKGKELALAFGVNLAIARMGQIGALWISPELLETGQWTLPAWFGFYVVMAGLIAYVFYILFDLRFDKRASETGLLEEAEEFRINDLKQLVTNKSFIYITLLCVLFYSAVFPFLSYAPDLLHNKFGFSMKLASKLTTIIPFGTVIFTPLFGLFVDKKGKSATLMIMGSVLLMFVHIALSLTHIPPYFSLFILGIAFSLVPAAMWPAVAKIVKENRLGTAYGVMTTVQNLGLLLFPYLIGKVLDVTNPGVTADMVKNNFATLNYTWAVLMLVGLGGLGVLFAFLLKYEDKKSGHGLETPSADEPKTTGEMTGKLSE